MATASSRRHLQPFIVLFLDRDFSQPHHWMSSLFHDSFGGFYIAFNPSEMVSFQDFKGQPEEVKSQADDCLGSEALGSVVTRGGPEVLSLVPGLLRRSLGAEQKEEQGSRGW